MAVFAGARAVKTQVVGVGRCHSRAIDVVGRRRTVLRIDWSARKHRGFRAGQAGRLDRAGIRGGFDDNLVLPRKIVRARANIEKTAPEYKISDR